MAKIATIELGLRGVSALLMHSERLVNPFDPIVKEIAQLNRKGRKKTEEDMLLISRLEWTGGLYFDEALGPYIPGANIKRSIMDGAAIFRGKTDVKRAVLMMDAEVPLLYDGPRTVDALWGIETHRDIRSVGINKNKVMRTRPRFNEWALQTSCTLDTSLVDLEEFRRYLTYAGKTIGLGDYRPTMGRYHAVMEVLEEIDVAGDDDKLEEEEDDNV